MIIDFNRTDAKTIPAFKGGEKAVITNMYTDANGKIALFHLEPGASVGYHIHDTSSEMIYIISGHGKALYDDGEEALAPGVCHYCPKGHSHSVINNSGGELCFFAVVPEQ